MSATNGIGHRLDAATIRAAWKGREREIVTTLLPDGALRGSEWWCLAPGRHDTHLGSFSVATAGDRAGCWHDFASGESGDLFDLVRTVCGTDFKGAVCWLARACDIHAPDPRLTIRRPAAGVVADWKQREASGDARGRGCTIAELARAKELPATFLAELGLRDLPARAAEGDRPAWPAAVEIPYRDAAGAIGARRLRSDVAAKLGSFWKRGDRPTLYGLERLRGDEQRLLLVEGESDCWCCWHAGIAAVGIPGATLWHDEWAAQLPSAAVVYVVQEPDAAGAGLVQRLARSPLAPRLRVVRLTAKDPAAVWVHDPYLERFRQTMEIAMADAVPPQAPAEDGARLILTSFANTQEERPSWLWKGYLARRCTAVIGGKAGGCKGLATVDIAARISTGSPMPDGSPTAAPGRVLIVTREDDPRMALAPRLRIAGADPANVFWTIGDFQTAERVTPAQSMGEVANLIGDAVRAHRIDLVIIDPLGAWIIDDQNSASQVRAVIDPMNRMAMETGCAVLFVAHVRKAPADDAMDAFAGSHAVTAAVRIAISVARINPTDYSWTVAKTNFRRPEVPLAFCLAHAPGAGPEDPPQIAWRSASSQELAKAAQQAQHRSPMVDPQVVLALMVGEQHPLKDEIGRIHRQLVPTMPGLAKSAVEVAIMTLVDAGTVHTGNGIRGAKTVGLLPAGQPPETATDRAVLAWEQNPTATVRAIAEMAQCSPAQAGRAKRFADLSHHSVSSTINDSGDNETEPRDAERDLVSSLHPGPYRGPGGHETRHAATDPGLSHETSRARHAGPPSDAEDQFRDARSEAEQVIADEVDAHEGDKT